MSFLTPHALCWRRILDNNSLEYAVATPLAAGLELAGTIVAIHDGAPLEVRYRIECDADWRTRTISIEQRLGLQQSSLSLAVDTGGTWSDQRGLVGTVAGCLDVDLELTPITNSLPVNRLNLAIGQVEEIAVAWIRFPSLEIVSRMKDSPTANIVTGAWAAALRPRSMSTRSASLFDMKGFGSE
jgi:uncharacterized protein